MQPLLPARVLLIAWGCQAHEKGVMNPALQLTCRVQIEAVLVVNLAPVLGLASARHGPELGDGIISHSILVPSPLHVQMLG